MVSLQSVQEARSEVENQKGAALQWQPDQPTLKQVYDIFALATSPDAHIQQTIYKSHQNLSQNDPNYCRYLALLLSSCEPQGAPPHVRQPAGLALKNLLDENFAKIPMKSIYYIQGKLKEAFYDEAAVVSKTVGSVMSMIMVRGGFNAWPDLLPWLTQNLQGSFLEQTGRVKNVAQLNSIVENAILAISIIVEDCSSLFQEDQYENMIEQMLQPIFALLQAPQSTTPTTGTTTSSTNSEQGSVSVAAKAHAINTINMLMITQCSCLVQHLPDYTTFILSLYTGDQNLDLKIKKRIIQGLATILEFQDHLIAQSQDLVMQVMCHALTEQDQQIGLAACEFWTGLISIWFSNASAADLTDPQEQLKIQSLKNIMPQVLHQMLLCCRITDVDQMEIMESKDADLVDERQNAQQEEDSGGDEYDDLESGSANTTLRKSACYALGSFSKSFQEETWQIVSPLIEKTLKMDHELVSHIKLQKAFYHKDDLALDLKEAGILALGAIADEDGCYGQLEPFLKDLVPQLVQELASESSLLKATSLWCLQKFSLWIATTQDEASYGQYLNIILQRVLDPNVNVQSAACTSLAFTFEKTEPEKLVKSAKQILEVFTQAMNFYKGAALISLFDSIANLAEVLDQLLRDQVLVDLLIPLISKKWSEYKDNDKRLLELFECFEMVIPAIGPNFIETHVVFIYERCLTILAGLKKSLHENPANKSEIWDDSAGFFIRSMELITVIMNTMQIASSQLIAHQDYLLLSLLVFFAEEKSYIARQHVFGLLGDIQAFLVSTPQSQILLSELIRLATCNVEIKGGFMSMAGYDMQGQQQFMQEYGSNNHNKTTACVNSVWAIGCICVTASKESQIGHDWNQVIQPYLQSIVARICALLSEQKLSKILAQNLACALGRVAILAPQALQEDQLRTIMKQWVLSLRFLKDQNEREEAYRGFCKIVPTSQQAVSENFAFICSCFIFFKVPPPEIENSFREIVHGYKTFVLGQPNGEQIWRQQFGVIPESIRKTLASRFGLF